MCGDEAAAARSMLQITYPVCALPGPLHAMSELTVSRPIDGKWHRQALG
jgi:hypothetical protein